MLQINCEAFKFPNMTIGWEMISMSSARMNHGNNNNNKDFSRDGVSSSCHGKESSAQVTS